MTKTFKTALAVAACLLMSLVSAFAEDLLFFSAPSKNINCMYDRNNFNDGKPYVRCDIGQFNPTLKVVPQQSAQEIEIMGKCTLPKMRAFIIEQNAQATSTYCPTDAPISEGQVVVPYGNTWSYEGFACISEATGMTCRNNLGHGFMLSRNLQKVF